MLAELTGATREALERSWSAARAAGVTRLADITRLDCVGVPVFQAIRPLGRALSVHQGKGFTPNEAKIGALMEAVESDHAEAFAAPVRTCAFEALSPSERVTDFADFASDRDQAPDPGEALDWVEARRLRDGGRLWVPFELVSLDFTWRGDPRIERSSNGLGARFDREGAVIKALLEVVERDADRTWQEKSLIERSLHRLDLESTAFAWFQDLRARLRGVGLSVVVYRQEAVIAAPAFRAELFEPAAGPAARGATDGRACDVSAEVALRGAVLEALQSRLTAISGVRDDIPIPLDHRTHVGCFGAGLPLPPGLQSLDWPSAAAGGGVIPQTSAALAEALARAGYPDAAVVDLSRPGTGVFVVKAIVPGLAFHTRRRRRPELAP